MPCYLRGENAGSPREMSVTNSSKKTSEIFKIYYQTENCTNLNCREEEKKIKACAYLMIVDLPL